MTDSKDILCGCVGLTREAAIQTLNAAPGQGFEAFLTTTGAGRVCTACMLDLEYLFVETPRPRQAEGQATGARTGERISARHRFYGLLDRLPPRLAYKRANWMPVLSGPGIDQYLWIANRPMLFGTASDEREVRVTYIVRDAAGQVRRKGRLDIPVGEQARVNLSEALPASRDLAIGSVQVDKIARRPGVTGTTRPQTEIVTPTAAAALHFQAANRGYDRHFSFIHRPDEDRTYFTVLNCGRADFDIALDYRDEAGRVRGTERVTLPPLTARLLTFMPEDEAPAPAGELITAHIRARGIGKLHALNAAPDLSAFSIDHL